MSNTNSTASDVVATMTPARVLINAELAALSPARAKREHGIEPDVIFVRNDGWSLGAPKTLEEDARRTWMGKWAERWVKRADGTWRRTWPMDDDPGYIPAVSAVASVEDPEGAFVGRATASDAIAQLNLARVGSLVTDRGLLLSAQHLPYLRELRHRLFEWAEQIEVEIARVEAES